jgi:hypothetical protein
VCVCVCVCACVRVRAHARVSVCVGAHARVWARALRAHPDAGNDMAIILGVMYVRSRSNLSSW